MSRRRRTTPPRSGQQPPEPVNSSHRTQVVVARTGAAAVIVAAIIGAIATLGSGKGNDPVASTPAPTSGQSAASQVCAGGNGGTVIVEGDVNCPQTINQGTTPADRPEVSTADAGCGSFGGSPGVSVKLRVVMWCAPIAVRGQYQYKLKVSVHNTGSVPLNIERTKFVLLWRSLNPTKWTPPPSQGPDVRPKRFVVKGVDAWGVFPNPDGAYETVPGKGTLFATHWSYQTLAPKQRSLKLKKGHKAFSYSEDGEIKTLRYNFHEDDLVFYVPVSTVNREKNFLGLGFIRGDRVIAVCPQSKWGPRMPPALF